jgi:type I restriction enzyme S subunit
MKGAPLSKADITDEGTPFVLYGELYTTYGEVTRSIKRRTDKVVEPQFYSKVGDVIMPTSGETPEDIATASCIMLPDVILAGDLLIYRTQKVDGRLVSFVVKNKVNKQISSVAQGKSVVHVRAEELSKISISYPSDAEQQKILTMLELLEYKMAKQRELIEHLKKYKRGLLDAVFNQKIHVTKDNEEWQECRIGDILKILHGRDYKDYQAPDGEYPVLGTGGIIDHATKYLCDWACVLIGRKGTIDKPQYMDTPFWTVDTLFYSKPEAFHNPKFQYYLFQTINWKKYNEASGVPSQSSSTIEGISVYVPNLKTQETIARLFSNVDELIEKQTSILSQLQESKKGLLQQLFI